MNCKIVYLKPRNSYKDELRSDTLWAALCWAIRMVHPQGKETLEALIDSYQGSSENISPFYISSTFPYQEVAGRRILFLPKPLAPPQMELPGAETPFPKAKAEMRDWKSVEQYDYLDLETFQYLYGGGPVPKRIYAKPGVTVRPMAHNTIDRLHGSTLTINKRGQLFHTEERFILSGEKGRGAGLYFLVAGDFSLLESALRFLEHYGIGGDRSIGKGRFEINWEDLKLGEPEDADAMLTLSLYHPTKEELEEYRAADRTTLNYQLEARQGWKSLQAKGAAKDPVLFFTEGSTFPLLTEEKTTYGANVKVAKHDAGYDIFQYGYGFMVKIKTPTA